MNDRAARLAPGVDEAADGYEAYYVLRFAPWVAAAVRPPTGTAPRRHRRYRTVVMVVPARLSCPAHGW